jgi:hypothetical protein
MPTERNTKITVTNSKNKKHEELLSVGCLALAGACTACGLRLNFMRKVWMKRRKGVEVRNV